MTLWELRLWQINKKEKEFSLNEIKELLISPKRARTYVPENMYDRFMTAYNKPVLCSTQKISFTYDKFIATAKKIISEFPCTYEDCYNDETDMGKFIYTKIVGGAKLKNAKKYNKHFHRNLMILGLFLLYRLIEGMLLGTPIIINRIISESFSFLLLLIPYAGLPLSVLFSVWDANVHTKYPYYSFEFFIFDSLTATLLYSCFDMLLIGISVWACKREYFFKITSNSTKKDKTKIYGKFFLIFAIISLIVVLGCFVYKLS